MDCSTDNKVFPQVLMLSLSYSADTTATLSSWLEIHIPSLITGAVNISLLLGKQCPCPY